MCLREGSVFGTQLARYTEFQSNALVLFNDDSELEISAVIHCVQISDEEIITDGRHRG